MNKFAVIVASLFAVTAFAAEPVKTETKVEAKPAVTAPAKEVKKDATPAKSEKPAVQNEKAATKPAADKPAK